MRFLLARRGFLVETADPSRLLDSLALYGADVVVMDGSNSLAAAARAVAEIDALHPSVRVLVVADETESGGERALGVLPKWSSVEGLATRVEGALEQAV